MSRIDDPASAVAASLCLLARSLDDLGITPRHPGPCGWCIWPVPVLAEMVTEFNIRAGYDPRRGTHERHDARLFAGLSRAEQVAQVSEAQSLEPLVATTEPMEQPEPAAVDEEVPSWL